VARLPYVDPAEAPPAVRDALENTPPLNVFKMTAHASTAFRPFLRYGGTLLARLELVSSASLGKGRKYAIVAILAVAAFITPPDPISQIGLALPMYLLYELSILSVKWVERSRAKTQAQEATDGAGAEEATDVATTSADEPAEKTGA